MQLSVEDFENKIQYNPAALESNNKFLLIHNFSRSMQVFGAWCEHLRFP
jgi:hypothetical protein